jgi:phosphoesterase RecJ-like protein
MIYTDPTAAAPAFRQAINAAQRILILSHVNPDGDAIGSMLALTHVLRALGKEPLPLASGELPAYARWLPGAADVPVYQPGAALPEFDLLFLVDTATPTRIGQVGEEHGAALAARPLAIVDHHVTNAGVEGVNLIDPRAASTCQLLYHLFRAINAPVDATTATCLLLGHMTDTQSFQVSSTTPAALRTAAALLEAGADHRAVVQHVYYTLPASSAALIGLGLSAMRHVDGIAWTTVSQAMMAATGAEDEAADELVKQMQRIAGIRALALFKERQDGTTKISLRSVPPYNVAALAQTWGGGGHAQAAGATLAMSPDQAEAEVLPRLRELVAGAP